MAESTVPASSQESSATAQVDAPPIPEIRPSTLWRDPYLIENPGHRNSIGWQDSRKAGRCFVVGRQTMMDSIKVAARYPLTPDGWVQAWATLTELDPAAASSVQEILRQTVAAQNERIAERERRTAMYEIIIKAEKITEFRALGVQILGGDDHVYSIGQHVPEQKANASRKLGPLAGSEAMVTDGAQAWSPGRAMLMPIALAGLATKTKADAAIVFLDGSVHTAPLDGNAAVRQAQLQVVQFNALAGVPPQTGADIAKSPAARLRALQELRDTGLISDAEYEAKRTEIIDSI